MHKLIGIAVVSLLALTAVCGKEREPINANVMRDRFAYSLELSQKANQLSQPPGQVASFKMPEQQEKQMKDFLRQSIALGKGMNSKFLNWLGPNLNDIYKNKLIKGMQLYLDGLEKADVAKQLQGNQLTMEWAEYWEREKNGILDKMYPDHDPRR